MSATALAVPSDDVKVEGANAITGPAQELKQRPKLRVPTLLRKAEKGVPEPLHFDGFLSLSECVNMLKELENIDWHQSLTYKKQTDGSYRDTFDEAFRSSKTAGQEKFSRALNAYLAQIEKRLQNLITFDLNYLETWQATSYTTNGHFEYHLDAGYWENHHAGERIITFLIYLTTPKKGGSTHFRLLDVDIQSKAGRLALWSNIFPNGGCDHRMIHSGTPVVEGEKITLVTWLRQKPFRNHKISI